MPIFESDDALLAQLPARCRERATQLTPFKHVLTHKDMYLSPIVARFSVGQKMAVTRLAVTGGWFATNEWRELGLPAPIRKLLENEFVQPDLT